MATHPTKERISQLLNYDPVTGVFVWKVNRRGGAFAGDRAGRVRRDGYVEIRVDLGFYQAHRLAWILIYGEIPDSMEVDHKNRIKSDNSISNLRLATGKQNKENVGPTRNSRSGLLGVNWNSSRDKWQARICHNGKRIYLGLYETAEMAHQAYLDAKRNLHSFCTI